MKRLLIIVVILAFACVANAEDVELAWDANTEADLWGYRVYRDVAPGGHVLGPTSPHLVEFIVCGPNDTSCAGYWELLLPNATTFYWVVTAVDNVGNESDKSNEVEHTTSAVVDDPPNSPTGCYIKTVTQ